MEAHCCEIALNNHKTYHTTTVKECACLCDIDFPGRVWLLWTPVAMATAHYSKDILLQMVHFLLLPVDFRWVAKLGATPETRLVADRPEVQM